MVDHLSTAKFHVRLRKLLAVSALASNLVLAGPGQDQAEVKLPYAELKGQRLPARTRPPQHRGAILGIRQTPRRRRQHRSDDTKELTSRILAAGATLACVCGDPRQEKVLQSLTADEGCFSVEESCGLQGENIRTVIGDPHASQRRKENQSAIIKQVLHKARHAVKSASGKALLRKRDEYIERGFAHVLDQGGPRRTTLWGKSPNASSPRRSHSTCHC